MFLIIALIVAIRKSHELYIYIDIDFVNIENSSVLYPTNNKSFRTVGIRIEYKHMLTSFWQLREDLVPTLIFIDIISFILTNYPRMDSTILTNLDKPYLVLTTRQSELF